MRFGKSAKEAAQEPVRGGGGGDFMRYIKDGDQTFRFMDEPDEWVRFWEHYNPMGFSFPCNDEDTCPGCVSDNEKMKKVSRRFAGHVLTSYNGQDYVNVLKVGSMVFDKLENRFARFGTICDRDYTITRYKTSGDRYDFDVEGGMPNPVDFTTFQRKDIEQMLADAWEESWGEGASTPTPRQEPAAASNGAQTAQPPRRPTIAPDPAPEPVQEEPPFEPAPTEPVKEEEPVYKERELRAMEYDELVLLVKREMGTSVPDGLNDTKSVVDWLVQGS